MTSKQPHALYNCFKNTPLVVLNKSDILFINKKAKQLLCFTQHKKNTIHQQLYQAISTEKKQISILCNHKEKQLKLITEKNTDTTPVQYLIFLEDITKQQKTQELINVQTKLFKEIFENVPVGIFLHDYGKIQYVNKEAKRIMGTSDKKKYLNYNVLNFLYLENEKKKAIERIKKTYTEKKLPPTIYHIKNFKNEEKIVELSSLLFYSNEKPLALLIVQDKTKAIHQQKLEIESQLKHQENKLLKKQNTLKQKLLNELQTKQTQLLNTINYTEYLFWITDEKLNIILFNKAFYDYCYKYYNIKLKTGINGVTLINLSNQLNPSAKKQRNESLIKRLQTKTEFEYEVKQFDKEQQKERVYKILFRPYLENKKIKNIYCYGHEITEKYEFLNQIEKQSIKLNAIIQNSPVYLWSLNKQQQLTLFNTNYEKIIQTLYGEKPQIGKNLSKGKYAHHKNLIDTLNYHYQKAFNGSAENFTLSFDLEHNHSITLQVNLTPIIINNQVAEVAGIATDITSQIEKQKQLETLFHENEILIKEVHHRIKNNLQVISSMINLQIQNEEHKTIKNVLIDVQNRIYSMVMIHQSLYQNRNYSCVNMNTTIPALIQNILFSFAQSNIELYANLEDIILDVSTAIPLSLIINEAITNIIKYAFPEHFQKNKEMHISLKRKKQYIELIIKDNGIGIPHEQIQNISNTGFTIIRSLSEQLNANLSIRSEPNQGTQITLLIPLF